MFLAYRMADSNHFALMGLPRSFSLDPGTLEAAWRRLQAAVHPDRHVQGSGTERRIAMEMATRVNEAYRVLRDPLRRAAYLCELDGVDVRSESNTAMPAEFLMQQMTWRETLEDARAGRDQAALGALAGEVDSARHELLARIRTLLDGQRASQAAADAVRQLMFLERIGEEIDLADDF